MDKLEIAYTVDLLARLTESIETYLDDDRSGIETVMLHEIKEAKKLSKGELQMKTTIDLNDFRRAFENSDRGSHFTYEALEIIFNYLEEVEDCTGDEIELDVIAICCDYEEMNYKDIFNSYPVGTENDNPSDTEIKNAVYDYLNHHTVFLGESVDDNFVFVQF